MTLTSLRNGSRGREVARLQDALNAKLHPSPNLKPDGIFGLRTASAVRAFQVANWLVADGIAGPATQAAAFDNEGYQPILHSIPLIPQPTATTCWAAATAMMTGSNVAAVKARTPADMWSEKDGLYNSSESDQAIVTGTRFGRIHSLRCHAPMSWMHRALHNALKRGPLMFDMLWRADEYAKGMGSPGHMIVVIGMRGDIDPSGAGTTLRINDPWPEKVGKVESVGFRKWMNDVPTRTYRVFER